MLLSQLCYLLFKSLCLHVLWQQHQIFLLRSRAWCCKPVIPGCGRGRRGEQGSIRKSQTQRRAQADNKLQPLGRCIGIKITLLHLCALWSNVGQVILLLDLWDFISLTWYSMRQLQILETLILFTWTFPSKHSKVSAESIWCHWKPWFIWFKVKAREPMLKHD